MKVLRVSEEKDGFKLRFGMHVEATPSPFELLITTVRIRHTKNLDEALNTGAIAARVNFARMQKFNEQ